MKDLEKVKLDFLELNLLLDQGLRDILKKVPHELVDSFGNKISEADPDKLDGGTYALSPPMAKSRAFSSVVKEILILKR